MKVRQVEDWFEAHNFGRQQQRWPSMYRKGNLWVEIESTGRWVYLKWWIENLDLEELWPDAVYSLRVDSAEEIAAWYSDLYDRLCTITSKFINEIYPPPDIHVVI